MKTPKAYKVFRKSLLAWHADIDRNLPWKDTDEPYKIWLSEIILQQTRVIQGKGYYLKIVQRFPTIQKLAAASEDEVLSLWKGLGYYARARNMHAAAKRIVSEYNGVFPNNYSEILKMKGVGPYTAAAIASFAFNLPYAVLDGNVFRVLSRYWGIETPIDSSKGKKIFSDLSQNCLDKNEPGKYNQAIMDFGALLCKPALPGCQICPLVESCKAYAESCVDLLPIKEKKVKVRNRYFHYLIINSGDRIILKKRVNNDIWKGLYELPMIEAEKPLTRAQLRNEIITQGGILNGREFKIKKIHSTTQRLTHRLIHGVFYEVDAKTTTFESDSWYDWRQIQQLGLPLIVDNFLKEYLVQ